MTKPPLILVIADLHSGSDAAPMPEGFIDHKGNEIKPNKVQEFQNRNWQVAKEWVKERAQGRRLILVLNGDAIEGLHHRTIEVVSHELGDHLRIAKELLSDYREMSSQSFVVRGTECHTGNTEMALAEWLNAESNPDTELAAFDRLRINAWGCLITFVHHVSTSSRAWTVGTGPISALRNEQIECVRNGETPPKVVCFAHRHNFGSYNLGDSIAIVSPPWQMLTRHGYKAVPNARTLPGLYMLDWQGKAHGDLPDIHELLFKQPVSAPIPV